MANSALTRLVFSTIIMLCGLQTIHAQSKFGKALIPDQVILQYAGSIGYVGGGIGYNLLKEKSTLSLHYGYIPEHKGGRHDITAVKFDYKPFKVGIGKEVIFYPFNPVAFFSYTFGQDLDFRFDSEVYADGYYFWSPALRAHLGASSELKLLGDGSSKIKSVSLFVEANTNDLYAINWWHDTRGIAFTDMFRLGFGLKMNF